MLPKQDLEMYWCYIVRCADRTLYTGITTDLKRRLREHNLGRGARYTAGRGPVRLIWKEKHPGRSSAQRREAQIKSLSRPEQDALVRPGSEGPRKILRTGSGFSVARLIQKAGGSFLRLDQKIQVSRTTDGWDATGPFWTYGLIRTGRSKPLYLHGGETVAPPSRIFAVFLPPYALAGVRIPKGRIETQSFTSKEKLPADLPRQPVVFRPPVNRCPESAGEVVRLLRNGRDFRPVSREDSPPPFAERIKRAIDSAYTVDQTLTALAKRLGTNSSAMSRAFKQAYGLPPVKYRHSLRVVDAMMRLLEGQEILRVCQDVGFSDLGRFYKTFGDIVCAPPARYRIKPLRSARPGKSKNAKK